MVAEAPGGLRQVAIWATSENSSCRHLGEWKGQQKLPSLVQAPLPPPYVPPLDTARSDPALR
jgi:hypothetical protein